MAARWIKQIPLPGGSGEVPTGAIQFQDDWPGLCIRGDDAIGLLWAIQQLLESVENTPDMRTTSALAKLKGITEMIERDVIVRARPAEMDENQA
jgi:hypothetical protein